MSFDGTPYHEGEVYVQKRTGEVDQARRNGSVIATAIIGGALPFVRQQPMAVLGSIDDVGRLWASLLFGRTGFIHAPTDQLLEIDLDNALVMQDDPFWTNIDKRSQVGMLLIELATRRRLRVNGRAKRAPRSLVIDVDQAYPNCPQYIQRRHLTAGITKGTRSSSASTKGSRLQPRHIEWIESADTLFIASAHPERGVDASHRGGERGFARMVGNNIVRIPDYPGNSMFNTLGNFVVYPHAGITFLDFEGNSTLQLVGRPKILWGAAEDPTQTTGGTGRYWEFRVEQWLEMELPARVSWEFLDASPSNPVSARPSRVA